MSKKGQKKRIRPQSIFFMLVFSEIRCVYKQNRHHQMSLLHISFLCVGANDQFGEDVLSIHA